MLMGTDLYKNISERAYFKYLEHPEFDSLKNWYEASREELLEEKIKQEAYLLHMRTRADASADYLQAKEFVNQRLKLLAYYLHEREYNKKPQENWINAQNMYINNF